MLRASRKDQKYLKVPRPRKTIRSNLPCSRSSVAIWRLSNQPLSQPTHMKWDFGSSTPRSSRDSRKTGMPMPDLSSA